MKRGFRGAALPPRVLALLEVVETLALGPWELTRADWQRLVRVGWRETEIFHAILGAAHFNYLNRMADGLGIRFEYPTDLPPFDVSGIAGASMRSERDAAGRSAECDPARPFFSVESAAAAALAADLPVTFPRAFAHALVLNPEAARGIVAWRGYEWTPTSKFNLPSRLRVATVVASALHSDVALSHIQRRCEAAGARPSEATDAEALFLDEHARRLTEAPYESRRRHVEVLRSAGWSDVDVLRFVRFVSYLNFEIRVLLGLGVPVDSDLSS